MPVSQLQREWLQQRFRPRQKLQTTLETLRKGPEFDPNASVNDLKPSAPAYLSSEFDASFEDRENRFPSLREQLSQIKEMGSSANEATAQALAYHSQKKQLESAAQTQAMSERQTELLKQIGSMSLGGGFIDESGNFNTGSVPASGRRAKVLAAAKRWLGTPYSWGGGGGLSRGRKGPTYGTERGAGTKGFDCSGLTDYAFSQIGFKIGGHTGTQMPWAKAHGRVVKSYKQLVPGDLLINGHHVAIYYGNGKMIEAPYTGGRVRIASVAGRGLIPIHLNY